MQYPTMERRDLSNTGHGKCLKWDRVADNEGYNTTLFRSPWPGEPADDYSNDPFYLEMRMEWQANKARHGKAPPFFDYSYDEDTGSEDAANLSYLTPDSTPQPQTPLHSQQTPSTSPPKSSKDVSASRPSFNSSCTLRSKQARWQYHQPVTRSFRSRNLFSLSYASGKIVKHSRKCRTQLSSEEFAKELVRSRCN